MEEETAEYDGSSLFYYEPPPPVDSYNLAATPAAILTVLYLLLAIICLAKDIIPRIISYFKIKNVATDYKRRLIVVYFIMFISTTGTLLLSLQLNFF